jgi:iron(III) transport system ATP-binding protein
MPGLVIDDVHKAFGSHPVLRGISLTVPGGGLTAILGASGSGKTTLLRLVAGFERADAGRIEIGEGVVDDGRRRFVVPERRSVGFVPQDGALFPHLTVEKNVGFGVPRRRRMHAVGELLEMVVLGGLGPRYPGQLSGGQQQRVALARALAISPALVLLDEPFSSLDAGLRASVRADVHDVLRRAGTTAVLVTHDQDEALSMADLVAVIRDGQIAQAGPAEALYAAPVDPDIARFVGEANLMAGVMEDPGIVRTALGPLTVSGPAPPRGERAVVLVRPEQIELARDPAPGDRAGVVVDYEYYGHDAVVRLRPEGAGADVLIVRVTGGGVWEPERRVGVRALGPVRAWDVGSDDASVTTGV